MNRMRLVVLKKSVFAEVRVKHLVNWTVSLRFDSWFELIDAYDASFHWTPYVLHSSQAFERHNHLTEKKIQFYVVTIYI